MFKSKFTCMLWPELTASLPRHQGEAPLQTCLLLHGNHVCDRSVPGAACSSWGNGGPWRRTYCDQGEGSLLDDLRQWHRKINILTLPMLRLLSPRAQWCKDFWKSSKPCHVGTHWKALAEYSQMSTHLLGFRWFFSFFASFCISQISHQQHKG